MSRHSLRQIFILGAAAGIVLPALLMGSYWVRDRYEREVGIRVRLPMTQYADVLSDGLAVAIWNVDKEVATKLVESVMRNPEVVRVRVEDEYRESFAFSEAPSRSAGGQLLSETRDVHYGGRKVGQIRIDLSTARVEREIVADLYRQGLGLLAQVILSLAFILLLFEFRLVRPLRELQAGADRLARGLLNQPIRSNRQDEIGDLAHDLDTMRGNLGRLIGERDARNLDLQSELEERLRAEEALRRSQQEILNLNATLEHRVAERTRELAVALSRLQTAHEELVRSEKLSALGSLVAGIAHELNTPIGNSLTVASTLQDNLNEFTGKMHEGVRRTELELLISRTRRGTGILLNSLGKAVELIASFKQVAVDQTSTNRRAFNLRETVDELVLTLGPTIRKTPHAVQVDIPDDITMESFPGPLGQVLTNLINNAFLHAYPDEQPGTVSISARHRDEEHIEITVTDDGCGIPHEHLNRIFDPFFTTKLGQGGSGLGLNIVYNLVTGPMGGSIAVHSEVGAGTSFIMTLLRVAPGEPARSLLAPASVP